MAHWEVAFKEIQEKKGILHSLLKLPAFCFENGIKLRNIAYDKQWKKSKKADLPVISIGNIVAGGTGKTPFTLFLAQALAPHFRIAILTRGYRSQAEKRKDPVVVKKDDAPEMVGDEALLLARHLENGMVISGKDRLKGAAIAKEWGATLIILDDGMQHRRMYRDMEIILVDSSINQEFLPAGFLRDEPKRLIGADLLVFTENCEFAFSTSTISISLVPKDIVLENGILKSLENRKVAIFCGIAKPNKFIETVKAMKGQIVAKHVLGDHRSIDPNEFAKFANSAKEKGAEMLLCTEKDWIKLKKPFLSTLPIGWVRRELIITKNPSLWNGLIEKIVQWRNR